MGGNILFFSKTRRYSREEYFELESELLQLLWENIFIPEVYSQHIKDILQPLKAYDTKDSFGDCDIIVNSKYLKSNYIESIVASCNLRVGDWSKNGNVLSFAYKNFQIDLIITPEEHFQASLNYFKFNDIGNLTGRMSKKLGIKYGHKGCELIVRDGDQVLGEILLDRDNKILFEILGLDREKWEKGFIDLEDMFRWVSASKYFNKDIYLLENRNHYSRTRDAKRKTYHEFLEWIKDKEFKNNYPHSDMTERDGYNIIHPYFEDIICKYWPHAKTEYDDIISRHIENQLVKTKIGGETVMELTGLSGKDLGMFMAFIKRTIDEKNLKPLILKLQQYTVNLMIMGMYTCYVNNWAWQEIPLDVVTKMIHGEDYVPSFKY